MSGNRSGQGINALREQLDSILSELDSRVRSGVDKKARRNEGSSPDKVNPVIPSEPDAPPDSTKPNPMGDSLLTGAWATIRTFARDVIQRISRFFRRR